MGAQIEFENGGIERNNEERWMLFNNSQSFREF